VIPVALKLIPAEAVGTRTSKVALRASVDMKEQAHLLMAPPGMVSPSSFTLIARFHYYFA